MKKFLRSLIKILLITGIAIVIVVSIGLIAGWQTAVQFSNGLFWAGVILASIGLLMSMSDRDARLNPGRKVQSETSRDEFAPRASAGESPAETNNSSIGSNQSFHYDILLLTSAVLLILIGYLITR
jgi:hypothetical protein